MAKQLSPEERQRIVDELKAGKSCHQVAKEFGRSKDTVSRIAAEFGVDLRRSEPKTATEAHLADARAKLAALADGLAADAARLREQLFAPHIAYNFGGKDNTYAEEEVHEPSARDKQALMTSIGIAVDKVRQITESSVEREGLSAVDAWLEDVVRRSRT